MNLLNSIEDFFFFIDDGRYFLKKKKVLYLMKQIYKLIYYDLGCEFFKSGTKYTRVFFNCTRCIWNICIFNETPEQNCTLYNMILSTSYSVYWAHGGRDRLHYSIDWWTGDVNHS